MELEQFKGLYGPGGRKGANNKLTAIMQIRNEKERYLEASLAELSGFVDEIVVVDDASEDGSAEVCETFAKVVKVVRLEKSLFGSEWLLRERLWKEAELTNPDWILSVDADEFYEDAAKQQIRELINQTEYDWVAFRMYDFWGSFTHYREDEWWNLHQRHTMTLVRYLPDYPYSYPKWDHHVPRLPPACSVLPGFRSELRVKHWGWAGNEEERRRKYERYKRLDPHGQWGSLAHYESILDPNPRLMVWQE